LGNIEGMWGEEELNKLARKQGGHVSRSQARGLGVSYNEVSGASIDLLLADLGRSGRNGIAVVRELRAERPDDYVPPDSNLEVRATEVLKPLRLTLDRQVHSGGEQWSGRVDLRDRFLPLVIEIQSAKYHSALLDRLADTARRDQLERDGFTVVEITDDELWTAPDIARQRVANEVRRLRRAAS
jgi:CheY-like chemotaxis protein